MRDDVALFLRVILHRPGRGARRLVAADVVHDRVWEHRAQARLHERPGATVLWLFLHPDHLLLAAILRENFRELFLGERIKLLDADDGDVAALVAGAVAR